jgi:hypothetical protein
MSTCQADMQYADGMSRLTKADNDSPRVDLVETIFAIWGTFKIPPPTTIPRPRPTEQDGLSDLPMKSEEADDQRDSHL